MAQQRGAQEVPKGLPKDFKKLADAMKALGWTFEQGKGHVKAFAPDGKAMQVFPTTPSDRHALLNARSRFRAWCTANNKEPGI